MMKWPLALFSELRVQPLQEVLLAEKKLLLFARWLSRDYASATTIQYVGEVKKAHVRWLGVPLESMNVAFYRLPMLFRMLKAEKPGKKRQKTPWEVGNFDRVRTAHGRQARLGNFGGGVHGFEKATAYTVMLVAFEHLLRLNEVVRTQSGTAAEKHPLVRILHSGFDLCTVGGRHDRLLFCFLGFGPLRPGVTVRLIVHYTLIPDACCPLGLRVAFAADSDVKIIKDHIEIFVSEDKNVDARNRRYVPIPAGVLGVDTPGDLEYYLKVCQPPSGGTLFAAPASPLKKINAAQPFTGTFNKNPYTASCAMVRRAFLRAYPESEEDEQKLFGGGSPRKTLAQLLFAIHRCRRMVIDFGGWADGEQQAVDSYFHYTLEQRCRILQNMLDDLVRVAELPAIDAAVCTQA